jgi:Chain length determinant protein
VEEREFELIEYLAIVWRQKWLVVLGTLACILGALLLSWKLPPTYRVTATIDTGDLAEARDRDVERLVSRINSSIFLDDDAEKPEGEAAKVTARFNKPSAIDLSTETRRSVEGVRAVEGVARHVVQELNALVRADHRADETRLNTVRGQLDRLRQEQEFGARRGQDLRQSLERLEKVRAEWARRAEDPTRMLIFLRLSDEIAAKERSLVELERQLRFDLPRQEQELERQASELTRKAAGVRPARLAIVPQPPRAPIRPRTWLNLAVGAVAGLMGSVLLACLVEYLRGRRPAPDGSREARPDSMAKPLS